jgi:hypothetical protein
VSVTPWGFFSPTVDYTKTPSTQPIDRLVPRRTISLTPEDAIMLNGFPRVPKSGVMARAMFSTDGVYYTERKSFDDINHDSWASFVGSSVYWDPVAGIWSPIRSNSPVLYQFTGVPGTTPVLDTLEYRSGKELMTNDALVFDNTVTLSAQFNEGLDDATRFTLAMALFCQDSGPNTVITFADGATVGVTPTGLTATMDGITWDVPIKTGPMRLGPLFLILELKPPTANLYAGYSPTNISWGSSVISRNTTRFAFTVGSPMSLFALDVWGDGAPIASQIVSDYASVLGNTDSPVAMFA